MKYTQPCRNVETLPSGTGTTHFFPLVGGSMVSDTTEGRVLSPVPGGMTFSGIRVYADAAPGGSNSVTLTLRKYSGGSWSDAGDLTVTLSGSATTATSTGSYTAAVGDILAWKLVKSAGYAGTPRVGWQCICDTDGAWQGIFGHSSTNMHTSATVTVAMYGASDRNNAAGEMFHMIPTGGALSNLYVALAEDPGSGKSYTFKVRDDRTTPGTMADSSLSVACTGDGVAGIHTYSQDADSNTGYVAGDYVEIQITPASSPATTNVKAGWCMKWTPDNADEAIHTLCVRAGNMSASAERWFQFCNWEGGQAAEARAYSPVAWPFQSLKMMAALSGTPGSGKSYVVTLKRSGTATPQAVTLDNSTYASQSDSDEGACWLASHGEYISCVPSGTPSTATLRVSIIVYSPPVDLATGCVHYGKWEDSLDDAIGATDFTNSSAGYTATAKLGTKSLDCSGGSKRVYLADGDYNAPTTEMTFAGWFRGVTSNSDKGLAGKGTSGAETFAVHSETTSTIRIYIGNASGVGQLLSLSLGGNNVTGEFVFVAFSYDGATGLARAYFYRPSTGYFTQAVLASGLPASLYDSAADFEIGRARSAFSSTYSDHLIEGPGIWNRALAFSEIAQLINDGAGDESWVPSGAVGHPAGRRFLAPFFRRPLEIGRSGVEVI